MHVLDTNPGDVVAAERPASWLAVVVLGVGSFAFVTTEFLPVGIIPQMAADLGVSEGQAGLTITGPGIAAAIFAPLSIASVGHIDRRKLLSICLAVVCASNVLLVMAEGFATILLARFIMGASLGVFWTIAGSLGPRLRPGPQAARATAIILSGISLGTVAGVPAGALIGSYLGWRAPFVFAAALLGVVVIALLALLPSIPSQPGSGLRAIPTIMRRPRARLALAATVLMFTGHTAGYTFISPYLVQQVHVTPALLSAILAGYGIAGFLGNLLGGWQAARSERGAVIWAALLLLTALTLLVALQVGVLFACLCVAVWGIAYGMMPVTIQTYMFGAAPDHLESAAAILVTTIQVAIGLGSSLGGVATDRFGVTSAFAIGIAGAALTAAVLLISGRAPDRT